MPATSADSEVIFTVPGHTVPWARMGGGKTVVPFIPAKQRSFMGVIKLFCQRALRGRRPLEGPLEVSIQAIYLRPKSHTRARREAPGAQWKGSKPDADNISKIVKDALNTIAWRDDGQIASLHVWKMYGDTPRLTVKIVQLGGGLC